MGDVYEAHSCHRDPRNGQEFVVQPISGYLSKFKPFVCSGFAPKLVDKPSGVIARVARSEGLSSPVVIQGTSFRGSVRKGSMICKKLVLCFRNHICRWFEEP